MARKAIFSTLIFVFAVLVLSCGGGGITKAKMNKDKKMYVGTVPFEPPLLYQDAGVLVGPDANLVQRLAATFSEDLGTEIEPFWITRSYKTLAAALTNEEIDFIVGAYGITDERKGEVQFSEPYHTAELVLIINPTHDPDVRPVNLTDKRIGVREGTAVEIQVRAKFPSATVEVFGTLDDSILSLRRGEVDAVIDDKLMSAYALATMSGAGHLEIVPGVIDTVEYAVAVRKRDAVLSTVNQVIADVKKQDLYAQWTEEYVGNAVAEVMKRHPERLERAQRAAEPRRLTIYVSKDQGNSFDIYRFANLSFVLTENTTGEKYSTSRIDFQGRTGVCSVQVPPGRYTLFQPKFNFSPGSLSVLPTDPDQVRVDIRLQADQSVRLTRS